VRRELDLSLAAQQREHDRDAQMSTPHDLGILPSMTTAMYRTPVTGSRREPFAPALSLAARQV
jgi:hypothetical protein